VVLPRSVENSTSAAKKQMKCHLQDYVAQFKTDNPGFMIAMVNGAYNESHEDTFPNKSYEDCHDVDVHIDTAGYVSSIGIKMNSEEIDYNNRNDN
jgi:hypothetical protein